MRRHILKSACLSAALVFCACRPVGRQPSIDPRLVQAINRGVSLMGQYDYESAVKAFEEALAVDPNLLETKANLAIALFNRGRKEDQDMDRAGILLEGVLVKDPSHLRALYFKGVILQHVGKAEEAITCLEKVVALKPDDGAAWYLLGLCKLRLGRPAEENLLRAVQLKPHLYSAYYQLSQAALRAGAAEKAKLNLERFKQLRESPLGESIELPQYNQMGELGLARPLEARPAPPVAKSRYSPSAARILFDRAGAAFLGTGSPLSAGTREAEPDLPFGGAAVGDMNLDGYTDLIVIESDRQQPGRLVLLRGANGGEFSEATIGSGLESVKDASSCAVGDYDNDEKPDLFVSCVSGNFLFQGKGDGMFIDVTRQSGVGGGAILSRAVLFLDADHDADLDIFVCNGGALDGKTRAANQLFRNNADGSFIDIAQQAGVACAGSVCVMALPGDLDHDRDMDLVVLRAGAPAKIFLNDLSGQFHEATDGIPEIRGDLGGALQDFNGDGELDVLALGKDSSGLDLFLGDGRGHFRRSETFDNSVKATASWGPMQGFRVADVDLDGDLDIAVFSTSGHLLLNAGLGRFVLQPQIWPALDRLPLTGAELFDCNGDHAPDLLRFDRGSQSRVSLALGQLSPPATGLAVTLSGVRDREGRTRSPASGFGVKANLRVGLHEQTVIYSGMWGGVNQSWIPLNLGLGGANKADYLSLLWPDGVAQVEIGLAAGATHKIAELQRKMSSCPVLFAWNGQRFEFVTDFAGVGGLGYYVAPGESARPQVLEHVKIEAEQLRAKNGIYELRVTEPMEETAYVDRLELLAIDHLSDHGVFPDERLAVTGPPATHELWVVDRPIFAKTALGPAAQDCTEQLKRADRTYAYQPPLDRRFCGFCQSHSLELDFGDQVSEPHPTPQVVLFVRGSIEYPYSQTVYAAGQAGVNWEPLRVECLAANGAWETIVPDAGVPGGIDRTMTIELPGRVTGSNCRLRLTTNLEIYYDQIFLAAHAGTNRVAIHSVPLADAQLRKVGFAREYSPDGRMPLIYDYHLSDATSSFHVLQGAYTRYGPVKELLDQFDDQYALVGPGDEIALRFDARALPEVSRGFSRSFLLASHTYCKDMDLYTATPRTLDPLPFRGMSRYPYPPGEQYPESEQHKFYRATYNTRIVE